MYRRSELLLQAFLAGVLLSCPAPTHGQDAPPQKPSDFTEAAALKKREANKATELWFGVLKTPVRNFRFVIELSGNKPNAKGKLRSLDEGNRTFSLTNVRREDRKLSFTLPLTAAAYESSLTHKGTQSNGTWSQRGTQLPLTLRQVQSIPTRKVKTLLTGKLNAIVQTLDIAFVELESGEVYFNSVSQKAGGFIATKEVNEAGSIVFRVPGVQAVFEGHYSDTQKTKLKGNWSQGLVTLAVTLTRQPIGPGSRTPTQPKPTPRPQTPKAPFPYTTERVQIPTSTQDVTLAGTLMLPRGKTQAGMILVSGSGPQDRDETIFDHKPFLVMADHFARQGIATLRYDDRGVAESTGDFATATSRDLANDAESAFDFLAARPELADATLGICGHSEGGLIAPLVAARNSSVKFVILMAAPGVDGKQIILSQGPLLMRAQGIPEHQIKAQIKTQEIILTIIRNHEHPTAELIAEHFHHAFSDDHENLAEIIKVSQAAISEQASPWLRTFLKMDPKKALMELRCPVLAINGTKDLQVDPVLNLSAIRDALQAAGNADIEVNVYPGLNHLFQACKTGLPSEYGTLEETVNLVPLQRMTSWTLERATKQ